MSSEKERSAAMEDFSNVNDKESVGRFKSTRVRVSTNMTFVFALMTLILGFGTFIGACIGSHLSEHAAHGSTSVLYTNKLENRAYGAYGDQYTLSTEKTVATSFPFTDSAVETSLTITETSSENDFTTTIHLTSTQSATVTLTTTVSSVISTISNDAITASAQESLISTLPSSGVVTRISSVIATDSSITSNESSTTVEETDVPQTITTTMVSRITSTIPGSFTSTQSFPAPESMISSEAEITSTEFQTVLGCVITQTETLTQTVAPSQASTFCKTTSGIVTVTSWEYVCQPSNASVVTQTTVLTVSPIQPEPTSVASLPPSHSSQTSQLSQITTTTTVSWNCTTISSSIISIFSNDPVSVSSNGTAMTSDIAPPFPANRTSPIALTTMTSFHVVTDTPTPTSSIVTVPTSGGNKKPEPKGWGGTNGGSATSCAVMLVAIISLFLI